MIRATTKGGSKLQFFVEIRDGGDENSTLIMRVCGYKKPLPTCSQGSSVLIRFQSNYDWNTKGFSLKVSPVDQSEGKE